MLKKLDIYIIKKFLATCAFFVMILVLIALVVDLSEKLNKFIEKAAPLDELLTVYYVNFIPHVGALLAPIAVFLGVILFTSRLANNTEIIAITGNGVSFYRMLWPYLIAAVLLTGFMLFANHWLVPEANKGRIAFELEYIHSKRQNQYGLHYTIDRKDNSETNLFMQRYSFENKEGYHFSLEMLKDGELVKQIRSPRVIWKAEEGVWEIRDYEKWQFYGREPTLERGEEMDTLLNFTPDDIVVRVEVRESMNFTELNNFIAREREKGSEKVPLYLVEKNSRSANAFAILVLTFIGVAFSTRKKRGAVGLNLAIGLLICIFFILVLRFSISFATNAEFPPQIAVWIPNFLFSILAVFLVRMAPK